MKKRITLKAMTGEIYKNQKKYSKVSRHPMPDYSLQELREWMKQQSKYRLVDEKEYRPSVIRKDKNIGFILENLKLVTMEPKLSLHKAT